MFLRKKRQEGLSVFFCTDVHGSTVCFKKFLNAPKYYASKGRPLDVMLIGGDITGKMMAPVIKDANGRHRSFLFGKEQVLNSEEELRKFETKADTLGIYTYIFEPEEYDSFKEKSQLEREQLFRDLTLKRLSYWMELAAERLQGSGVDCYMSPGNDDFDESAGIIDSCPTITCPDRKIVRISEQHEMANLGYANLTPFNCPRDVPEETLTKYIDEMAGQVEDMENCVFNLHCPPINSGLDEAPELDEELRPRMGTTGVVMASVGSTAVKDAIEKYQPLLGLHGHIHEAKGTTKIGRTRCINAGSEYSEGILHGALVTLGKGKVLNYLLTSA